MNKALCIILSIIITLGVLTLPALAAAECIGREYGEKYSEDGFDISYYKDEDEEFVCVEKYYMDRWKDIDGVHRTHPHDRFKVIFSEGRKTACLAKYEGSGDSIVLPDTVAGVPVTSMDVDCFADYGGHINEIHLGKYFSEFNYLSIPRFPELAKITVSPENEKYYDIDGILMQRNECTDENYKNYCGDTMLFCPHNAEGTFYVPDEAGIIATGAFRDIKAEEIVLSEYTFKVCQKAFQNCSYKSLEVRNPYITSNSPYSTGCNPEFIYYDYDNSMSINNNSPLRWVNDKPIASGGHANGLITVDGMQFYKSYGEGEDGTDVLKLWKYTGGAAELNIPETVKGVPVTEIMARAFMSNKYLTKVTVPDTVKVIMPRAFSGAEKLSEVVLGDGVEDVGYLAFSDCVKLMTVTIGKNVKNIDANIFRNCSNLENTELSAENENLCKKDGVIYNADLSEALFCPPLAVGIISVPGTVRKVCSRAFFNCRYIKNIILPAGLQYIGTQAFAGCSRLSVMPIPETVTRIGSKAFSGCSSVTEYRIPEGITDIPADTFSGCTSIKILYLPESLATIGKNAFSGCDSLTDVYYAANVFRFHCVDIEETGNAAIGENVTWHFIPAEVKSGDINSDNKINAVDSALMRRMINGDDEPDEESFCAADLNTDAKLNMVDSNLLRCRIVGID